MQLFLYSEIYQNVQFVRLTEKEADFFASKRGSHYFYAELIPVDIKVVEPESCPHPFMDVIECADRKYNDRNKLISTRKTSTCKNCGVVLCESFTSYGQPVEETPRFFFVMRKDGEIRQLRHNDEENVRAYAEAWPANIYFFEE